MKTTIRSILLTITLLSLGLVPITQAVSPPPDGDYPGGNTAEGFNALFNLSSQQGGFNTAVGWYSLFSNVTGSLNTALGAGALNLNTSHNNTAVGAGALFLNTSGNGNTAVGAAALLNNDNGAGNTAVGAFTLFFNTGGPENEGVLNTAVGLEALTANTTGRFNTAIGGGHDLLPSALGSNTTGDSNTAVGQGALGKNTAGSGNTAIGKNALFLLGFASPTPTPGESNIAVGDFAGSNLITGSDNIYIGNQGMAAESNTIRIGTPQPSPTPAPGQNRTFIAGIYGSAAGPSPLIVMCGSDGKLSANSSSRRFKHDIKAIDKASEAILALKPVSFRYNDDPTNTPWVGLIAEEVANVNPDLIVRDKEGKPFGVRYDQVNAMLLNEFLKEHRKVEQLEKQVEALTAGLQKVSAELEVTKAAPQTVLNNQ